jgi:CRP-like cAMP-binding protein
MTRESYEVELLRPIPIFRSLSDEDLRQVIESPNNSIVNYAASEIVIREHDVGDCMYVILIGTVDVRIKSVNGVDITIATLSAGDYFGEQALLPGSSGKRNASVHTLTASRLFRIARQDVIRGVHANPDFLPAGGSLENASTEDRIRMTLRSVRLFRSLKDHDLANILEWTDVADYPAGEVILRESKLGDAMFVVLSGSIEIFVQETSGVEHVISNLTLGHYFGEQALLPEGSGKRNANVRAKTDVTLITIAREYFRLVLNRDDGLSLVLQRIGTAQKRIIDEKRHADAD